MSTHTPGDWVLEDLDDDLLIDILCGSVVIATITAKGDHDLTDEERANAQLIALAPKLLALCESFAALMPATHVSFGEAETLIEKLDQLCEQAHSLLKDLK